MLTTLACFRSKDLQDETAGLRERIKHLNDMVFCQQRKVKGMIEEVRRADLSAHRSPHHTCVSAVGKHGTGSTKDGGIWSSASCEIA